MGTWGTGTLDNDEALDTICGEGLLDEIEFFEDGTFECSELLEAIGNGVTDQDIAKMYFGRMYELNQSDDFCNAGIASCELAAYMNSKPHQVFLEHESVCKFIDKYKENYRKENIKEAFLYISNLIEKKHSYDVWAEKNKDWDTSLKDLRERLK